MDMRITLLGANGYIGSAFKWEIISRRISLECPPRSEYTSFRRLTRFLRTYPCDLVINAAAFVTKPSVDLCEDHKAETLATNLVLPVKIANACEFTGTPLIHVSTGCLYNGDNGGRGYNESDPPQLTFDNGCGVYVGSKQLAEDLIEDGMVYKCRIRIPFDEFDHERNYLSKIQRYAKVYSNTNSISHRGDFVSACLDLAQTEAPYGTYNVVNEGAISAREIVELMRKTICTFRDFQFWEEEDFMMNAARTMKSNCVLDISKLLATGVRMRHVQEAVQHSLENWTPEYVQETH